MPVMMNCKNFKLTPVARNQVHLSGINKKAQPKITIEFELYKCIRHNGSNKNISLNWQVPV